MQDTIFITGSSSGLGRAAANAMRLQLGGEAFRKAMRQRFFGAGDQERA